MARKATTDTEDTNYVSKSTKELPEMVDKVLKVFSNCEELYVTDKGNVFTVETPEIIRGNAVLYTNPYFSNK